MTNPGEFGDRMKAYEMAEAGRRVPETQPFIARLDGKCFSKFTRGLKRPYDMRLSHLMIDTAKHLMVASGALLAYTQSDEITLVYHTTDKRAQRYYDGRIQKLTSVLASTATSYFVRHLDATIPEKAGAMPVFDCRVWAVPNTTEAANAVLWRILDAERNSVSTAAQTVFSHKSLQGVDKASMKARLVDAGSPWDAHPAFFKWGTLLRREIVKRRFTAGEISLLEARHHARENPEMEFERTELRTVPFRSRPKIASIIDLIAIAQ